MRDKKELNQIGGRGMGLEDRMDLEEIGNFHSFGLTSVDGPALKFWF